MMRGLLKYTAWDLLQVDTTQSYPILGKKIFIVQKRVLVLNRTI